MAHAPKIFDAHVHVQPYWEYFEAAGSYIYGYIPEEKREWMKSLMDSPEKFVAHMDEEGVGRAVLVNYLSPKVIGFSPKVNEFVSKYVKGREDRLVACGGIDPFKVKDARKWIRGMVSKGIRVLKLHPPHQLFAPNDYLPRPEGGRGLSSLRAAYAAAEKEKMIVMIHTGTSVFPLARNRFGDPMAVDDVAVDFPDLKIVLAHAGRPFDCAKAVFVARRHKNVFFDVSSMPPSRLLHYLPDLERLSSKAIYGSDWPAPGALSLGDNARGIAGLPLSEDAKERILRENASRVFG
jgi:hypothetical protein